MTRIMQEVVESSPFVDDLQIFQALIARIRAGDDDAARELVEKYQDTVRRFIRVRLTDPALRREIDSGDICQSVMADFFVGAALGQFDLRTPTQLIKLLARMARNQLINQSKKLRAARRDVRRLDPISVHDSEPAAATETPSQIVGGRELLKEFRNRLSEFERQLADRRARGEIWADIAQAVDGDPEALRKQLERAVKRVAGELGLDGMRHG